MKTKTTKKLNSDRKKTSKTSKKKSESSPSQVFDKQKNTKKMRSRQKRILKDVQQEVLDRLLLTMGAKKYNIMLNKIQSSKKIINEERKLALQLGQNILNKAKMVRDTLIRPLPKKRK